MLVSLAPVGMLETTLAERLILSAWRLRRVAHYESEQTRLIQENATEVVSERLLESYQRTAQQRHTVVDFVEAEMFEIAEQSDDVERDDEIVSDDVEFT